MDKNIDVFQAAINSAFDPFEDAAFRSRDEQDNAVKTELGSEAITVNLWEVDPFEAVIRSL